MNALSKALEVAIDTPISPLTFDELHAAVLGTSMGYWFGRREMPLLAAIAASLVMLGLLPDSEGSAAIVNEPWYFIGPMLVGYHVGLYA